MNSYFCKTLKDQIKCQEMLFTKGAHWIAGQEIQHTDKYSPVVYHFREYDKSLTYSKVHTNFKEVKEAYPRCIYFRTNNLMETE